MRSRLRGSLFGEPLVPVKVDRYVVLEPLGSGGLGVVYAAYDPKLDRRVALKLINPARVSPEAAQRMQREAQAMAKLTHPNVAAVHDTGTHGEGTFIAMELVKGVTLSQWIQHADPDWKTVRDVMVRAGQGLDAAHREGLIHRDFKPANVLVDPEGRPRVLDFGLACAVDEVPASAAASASSTSLLGEALTETGVVLGTPQYMAPEQFAGRADARSDQFSFCATAWELLYGRRPFIAPDVQTLQRVVLSGQLTPPPAGTPVPGWVEKVLRRGLSLRPDERHPSMEALLQALQRDKRSRRVQVLALVGAVLLSGVSTGTAVWLARPEPEAQMQQRVEQLERDARDAAAAGLFIYPPASAPDRITAFASVIALEQLQGPIAEPARERAAALRAELAETLVALGDDYAEREGGTAFAADYYAEALLFDPEHPRARERSSLTPGELSLLRTKASRADFSEAELRGAQVLAALAEPDEPTRTKKIAALYRRNKAPATSTSVHLERLLGEAPLRGEGRRPAGADDGEARPELVGSEAAEEAAAGDTTSGDAAAGDTTSGGTASEDTATEDAADEAGSVVPSPPAPVAAGGGGSSPSKRDTAGAKAEARAGRAALARGDDTAAAKAFHRALDKDRRNKAALVGLSELYFERGAYQKALSYARKAAAVAPRDSAVRMQLGDAYFKVHRYGEARREYEQAATLGHKGAARALKRLRERVGDQ